MVGAVVGVCVGTRVGRAVVGASVGVVVGLPEGASVVGGSDGLCVTKLGGTVPPHIATRLGSIKHGFPRGLNHNRRRKEFSCFHQHPCGRESIWLSVRFCWPAPDPNPAPLHTPA